jgi:hypothetical protein
MKHFLLFEEWDNEEVVHEGTHNPDSQKERYANKQSSLMKKLEDIPNQIAKANEMKALNDKKAGSKNPKTAEVAKARSRAYTLKITMLKAKQSYYQAAIQWSKGMEDVAGALKTAKG